MKHPLTIQEMRFLTTFSGKFCESRSECLHRKILGYVFVAIIPSIFIFGIVKEWGNYKLTDFWVFVISSLGSILLGSWFLQGGSSFEFDGKSIRKYKPGGELDRCLDINDIIYIDHQVRAVVFFTERDSIEIPLLEGFQVALNEGRAQPDEACNADKPPGVERES